MKTPLDILNKWIKEEKINGNPFPQGAVLCTVSKRGIPHSRVVGTMLDDKKNVRFHTSPNSRKVKDIEFNYSVSLTYSFQYSLRSISIEGIITPLNNTELDQDWMKFDIKFRRDYLVVGNLSGNKVEGLNKLKLESKKIFNGEENNRPDSFIGYKFIEINRISFYSVKDKGLASSVLYENNLDNNTWLEQKIVP